MSLRHLYVLGVISLTISCQMKQDKGSILAKAYGNELYLEDLATDLAQAESKVDSTLIIDKKTDEWLSQEILYKEAKTRLKEDPVIENMVDTYKKELYIHKLEGLLKSELATETSWNTADLQAYIESEGLPTILEEPMMKFLMVKVPHRKESEKLQTLWKTEDLPGLKYYISQWEGFAKLDLDKWHTRSQISNLLPDSLLTTINFKSEKSYSMRHKDDIIYYKTLDHLSKGDSIPSEILAESLNNKLSREKFKEFINSWKTELFNTKIQSKDIQIMSQQG